MRVQCLRARKAEGRRRGTMGTSSTTDAVFRTFFDLAPDVLCVLNTEGCFERVSRAVEVLGYSADELVSLPLLEFLHPEDRMAMASELTQVTRGVPMVEHESR